MATEQEIVEYLKKHPGVIPLAEMEKPLRTHTKNLKVQIKRLQEKGLVFHDEDCVNASSTEITKSEKPKENTPEEQTRTIIADSTKTTTPEAALISTQISEGITPRDAFADIGKRIGIPQQRLDLIVSHIFTGDTDDIAWIYDALRNDMEVRQDLARMWAKSWASSNQITVPEFLKSAFQKQMIAEANTKGGQKSAPKKPESIMTGDRDPESISWDIDPTTGLAYYAGANMGSYKYNDALELARVTRSRIAAAPSHNNGGSNPVDQATQTINLMKAMKEIFTQPGAEKKSWVIKPGDDGKVAVEEYEEGKPVVYDSKPPEPQGRPPVFMLNPETRQVEQIPGDQPIVIHEKAPAQQMPQPFYLVDTRTGKVTEQEPGKPIIINVEQPREESGLSKSPIQMPDGSIMNLSDYLILDKHNREQKREEEAHDQRVKTLGMVREFFSNIALAATRMAGQPGGQKK